MLTSASHASFASTAPWSPRMWTVFSPLMFHLFFILISLSCQQDERIFDGCGGVKIENYPAPNEFRPPAAVSYTLDPNQLSDFVIQFVVNPIEDSFKYERLVRDGQATNNKLGRAIKGKKLPRDIRFPRTVDPQSQDSCHPARCSYEDVPAAHTKPCYVGSRYIPEPDVTINASASVLDFSQRVGGVSLVMYVTMAKDDNDRSRLSCRAGVVGHAVACAWDLEDGRPTHGQLIFCGNPRQYYQEQREAVFLHETLHVLVPDLLGFDFPTYMPKTPYGYVRDKKAGENVTWTKITRNFVNADGSTTVWNTEALITRKVREVVRERFNCPELEGAEVGTKPGNSGPIADSSHWTMRIFPDEILSPYLTADQRLTDLTLALLNDSGWYSVFNWNAADPTAFRGVADSRDGCDAAKKSSHEIFNRVAQQPYPKGSVYSFGALCDPSGRVLTTRCSLDGNTRFQCGRRDLETNFCDILHPDVIETYYQNCKLADSQPAIHHDNGFAFGNKSMCLTFTRLGDPRYSDYPFPACLLYTCGDATSKTISFTPNLRPRSRWNRDDNSSDCRPVTCTPNHFTAAWNRFTDLGSLGCRMDAEIVCPDYNYVCYPRPSAREIKPDAVQNRRFCFVGYALLLHLRI